MSNTQDYKAQLAKQLRFLDRSAQWFDEGHSEEAFRIATALRVIFHQTSSSTSLLTHLGAPKVDVRSTVPNIDNNIKNDLAGRKVVGQYMISLCTVTVSSAGCVLLPKTEVANHDRMIPWSEWWDETFAIINDKKYTRRSLVLWAANKDGGAHVDDKLKAEYEAIKASGALGSFQHNGQSVPIEEAHLVFLRSMAFEVLTSPQLGALT